MFAWKSLHVLKMTAVLIALFGFLAVFAGPAFSEFYKYVDKKGTIFFVDDLTKIPIKYRNQINIYQEKYDHLTDAEKEALLKKTEDEENLETDVIIKGNNVLIPVTLGYGDIEIDVVMVLDTGASIMTIHREIADRLDIMETQKATARIVGGNEINFNVAQLKSVKVGPHEKKGLLVGIIDHQGPAAPHNGLLGMNFLQHYEYAIDFKNQVVRWKAGQESD
jgi:hypothetical protein